MSTPLYKNAQAKPEERTHDLLSRMSVKEKVGQVLQLDGQKIYADLIRDYQVGSLLHINGADADAAIKASLETRLGIPVLLADDGIHGHSFWAGATIFPTQLSMASSWNTGLIEEIARITAVEMRATGLKWTFSPVLCISRDLRWGRVGETFGEDPWLIGELGAAMIRGYQGKGLDDPHGVLATAKHYAGYSETLGGRDASEADLSRRKLRSWFFPPFERAAKAGCMAFMTGYQSIDGVPSTVNSWLLKDVLREEWGFEGVLVTDWYNVGHLVHDQKVCANFAEAATRAVRAGNDLMMACPEFYHGCLEAIEQGMLKVEELDEVVARVLLLKFRLGLFEEPGYSNPQAIKTRIGCPEHRQANLRMARESLVLLRNQPWQGTTPVLPLDQSKALHISVLGANANDPLAQLGDWSLGSGQMVGPSGPLHPRETVCTVLDGIKALLPPTWNLVAPEESSKAQALILVLGDKLDAVGEGKSTATLELPQDQQTMAQALVAQAQKLNQALILVLINSKPLVLPPCLKEAHAIIEAFNPGMEGGRAIAETIMGQNNPSGKLTVSFPKHVGQQPIFYNQVRGQHGTRYADLDQVPAWSFGFGLSYSTFKLSTAKLARKTITSNEYLDISVEVEHISGPAGSEVIQAYIEDLVTSATWASRELKGYAKVYLAPGERTTAHIRIAAADCTMVNGEGMRVLEPGRFRLHVGTSSRHEDLQVLDFEITK